ncbi:hypothetical protein M378DRAFT_962454 [Amanita muscaria Koide BX008]|uniref:Rhodopsin domain-containing protein n=1 Tax=Amanita muscaria (strain Koide BX008) TaxID=946122 RepID=A0A0C2WT70_AMAMK|nr:hypothetical protein M378DRAFT_962454 [Amanita muscaria Koide BX008]
MPRQLREIEVITLIFAIPAVLSVVTRVGLRRKRLWADDIWALVSLLALVVQIVGVFIYTPIGAIRYYMMAITFYVVIWTARLSLLFSIIRIDPHKTRRKCLYVLAALYVIACLLLITQLLYLCQHESQWKTMPTPQCHLTLAVGIAQLTTDILADGTLLVAPMLLFRELHDRRMRLRLSAIFSTCVITTIVSIVHASLVLSNAGPAVAYAGVVEDCTSLIVCNIPVIATAIVRQHTQFSFNKRTTFVISTIAFGRRGRGSNPNENATFGSSLGTESALSNKEALTSKLGENVSTFDNSTSKGDIP